MKVKCRSCKEYVEKEDAYRVGISSYCDNDCYLAKKRDEWSGNRLKRASNANKMPGPTRTNVIMRDGGRCRSCNTNRNLHVHHIRYRSEGGTHDEDNLITLCETCHDKAHSNKRLFQPLLIECVSRNEPVRFGVAEAEDRSDEDGDSDESDSRRVVGKE